MKASKITLLSLGGIVVGTIVLVAVVARVTLGWVSFGWAGQSGGTNGPEPGEMATASRDLVGFSGIEINGSWTIDVTRGDEWEVQLAYPENYLNRIDVSVNGDRLSLDGAERRSFFGGSEARFAADIVMPELAALEVAGSSRVMLSGFEGERLSIDVAGANQIAGEDGRYGELGLSVAGANDIQLAGFIFTDADVDLAGASNLTLTMDGGELTGGLAGAGNIEYHGTVSLEAIDVAGFGSVGPGER